jgi:hypothetical protein
MAIPQSFPPNRAPRMREIQQLFLGLQLVRVYKEFHHSAIQTKIEENFGGFFHQIKVCQPIGRKDSKQPVIPTSKRLRNFISSQIFKNEIKKSKSYND